MTGEQNAVKGVVVDGYISGATVFLDLDGDEEWNKETEPFAITGDDGSFALVSTDSDASVIAEGGTDVSTDTAFEGQLKGPVGSTVISPLTTVMESMVRYGFSFASYG